MIASFQQTFGRVLVVAPDYGSRKDTADDQQHIGTSEMITKRGLAESSARSPRLCFASDKDIGREIRGSLKHVPPPDGDGHFSYDDLSSFPYASQGHCAMLKSHAYLKLEPDDCKLPGFEPLELLEKLRGHRLVFWGDSVTRQFFSYVSLRLKRFVQRHPSNRCLPRKPKRSY